MNDDLDRELIRVAESAIIVLAIKQLIYQLEADRTEANRLEIDGTIALCKAIIRRFYKISKTPIRKVNGRYFPITTVRN